MIKQIVVFAKTKPTSYTYTSPLSILIIKPWCKTVTGGMQELSLLEQWYQMASGRAVLNSWLPWSVDAMFLFKHFSDYQVIWSI